MRRVAALAAVGLISLAAGAVEREAPAERLRVLEERRRQIESILGDMEEKRSRALETLDRLDRERVAAANLARQAQAQAAALGAQLDAARDREKALAVERRALSHDLGPRLLLRYHLREGSWLQTLLSAPSIGDVLWRRRMLDKLLAGDLSLVSRWAEAERKEAAAAAQVERQRALVAHTALVAEDRADAAEDRDEVENGVLAGIHRQRATLRETIEEIDQRHATLQAIVESMPPPPPGLGGFGGEKGRLPWPVSGTIEVKFGREHDRKLRTVLWHKGCDLRADAGAPVVAPYTAMVGYSGWFSGFGNLVILDHGEGYYTLYAHLRSISVAKGQKVMAGTKLGEVGDTGSLKGAYLYFEIRSGSKPLDPGDWLAAR